MFVILHAGFDYPTRQSIIELKCNLISNQVAYSPSLDQKALIFNEIFGWKKGHLVY